MNIKLNLDLSNKEIGLNVKAKIDTCIHLYTHPEFNHEVINTMIKIVIPLIFFVDSS